MRNENIEDIYNLSPIQDGILFHSLYMPESRMYFEQFSWTAPSDLDFAAFGRAWQMVVDRHPILRTSFFWEDLDEALQMVSRRAQLPIDHLDWRGVAPDEQQRRLAAFLKSDRGRGFELTEPPLMRLTIIQLNEHEVQAVWRYHHLLLDGWSVAMLLEEVFTCYEAICQDQVPRLERRRPYRDYIGWLRRQDMEEAKAFWQRTLQGFSTPTVLALPQPSARGHSDDYAQELVHLSVATTEALQTLSRQQRVTMNTLMQGAWAILLSWYSGEHDVVFGTTVSGRPASLAGAEKMIGVFINTLPVRAQVTPDARLLEWLKALQEAQVELRQYEHSPLVEVQGWSEVPRGQSLFETIVVFENYPVDRFGRMRNVQVYQKTNYPLTVVVEPGTALTVRIGYDTRRFDGGVIERMLQHFQMLLERIAADPEQRIADLSLLTAQEWQELLVTRNATQAQYPRMLCTHQVIEAQVDRSPDAVAVVCAEQQVTYRALDCAANQVAHYLYDRGVRTGMRVGVCVERSLGMLVGLLGIFKVGAAFVPLDPAFPKERMAFMLADAEVTLVLTQRVLVARLPDALPAESGGASLSVVCVDGDWAAIAGAPGVRFAGDVSAEHLAYLIYTSGSTGRPKGVLIPHYGLVNYLAWCAEAYGAACGRGAPVHASIAADAIFPSLFAPLVVGSSVMMFPGEHALDAVAGALVSQGHFSMMKITPSQLEVLNHTVPKADARGWVRTLVIGAEALYGDVLAFWQEHAPDTILLNEYGPTETVVGCSMYQVPVGRAIVGAVPIGLPIANTQFYVLDAQMRPVPVGVPGELYIGGDGVAWGYHNHPERTAMTFVPNPFGVVQGEQAGKVVHTRLYKTGDLVRALPDRAGNIEFLGRIDDQVKIRGYRVEPGEVAEVLSLHPAVRDAVVLAREDVLGDRRLVAYVVPIAGVSAVDEPHELLTELRGFLKERLPEYMVPSAYVVLEALPLAPHGKLDRRALPAPDMTRAEVQADFVAPRSPIEEQVAEIWRDVLGVPQVGVYDNFFALGGHSLLATQVVARIRRALQVDLPVRSLFETPTIATLVDRIAMLQQEAAPLPVPPLVPMPRDVVLPLSFAQQRLWFLAQLQPESPAYNIPIALHLVGALDVAALAASLNAIIQRHETLRTTFVLHEGRPVQVIAPSLVVALEPVELPAVPPSERYAAALRWSRSEAQQPFDLAAGPLLRATLLRLTPTEHVLHLVLHHIVSDGWSTGVLIQEASVLYAAAVQQVPAALPDLPIQYADYAVWQRAWLDGAVLEAQLAYWRQHLGGHLPVLDLPTDRPRPAIQTFHGATMSFPIAQRVTQALTMLSQQAGCTLFMTLLAAFQTLLYRYSGQEDLIVGSPIAGRTRVETEGLIGFFVNTLALRTSLADDPPFLDLLARVREVCLGAYAHQDLPFEKLVEELRPERDLSRTPIFQVMFSLQNTPVAHLELAGLSLSRLPVDSGTARFDLNLTLEEIDQGIVGLLEYNTDLFDVSTIERLLGHFVTLLEGIVAQPGQRLTALPLIGVAERQQILADWCVGPVAAIPGGCLHQLIEAQAARTPNAVALVFEDQTLPYRELNRRANQLAQHLRSLRVGPDVPVAVCLERSLDLLVGLLGILKAGGAYVPLDPTYPAERVRFMLEDSQAVVVVTQQSLVAQVEQTSAQVVCVDRDWPLIARLRADAPLSGVLPDHMAYMIYTSGSTGQPKGAMISHRAIVNRLQWMQEMYQLTPQQRVLQKTPISFDVSVWELFWPLMTGARLVIARPGGHQDSAYLRQVIVDQGITTLHFVPSMLDVFLAERDVAECVSLREIICSGEALSYALQERVFAQLDAQVHNLYGPTEAAVDVTFWACERASARPLVPIGRPISNIQVFVLDRQRQLVPVGVPGELYLGGVGLARGYWGRADLTAERFVPNPFGVDGGAGKAGAGDDAAPRLSSRLYRTGDLVRYLSDGALDYLGRIDAQVKVRGFRIELGEIEAVLLRHAQVRAAVVVVREDVPGDRRLVAYVVPEGDEVPTFSELRSYAKEYLPDYMVPVGFVTLESLPLLPNGKVNRRALPAPDTARPDLEKGFVAPRTATEEQLAQVMAAILVRDSVGVYDSFFELGGHSLLAIQVLARVRDVFEVELPLRTLYEAPTVAELAMVIVQRQAEQMDNAALDAMLAELNELSDAEVQQLLGTEEEVEEDASA